MSSKVQQMLTNISLHHDANKHYGGYLDVQCKLENITCCHSGTLLSQSPSHVASKSESEPAIENVDMVKKLTSESKRQAMYV
jgi:hypothetical protein